MEIKTGVPVDKSNQLRIDRVGEIFIFTNPRTKEKWFAHAPWIRAMIYRTRRYYYASKYIPLPRGKSKNTGL